MNMRPWMAGVLALLALNAFAAPTPWQKITHPVAGNPQAIGAFANGCIIGARPLPLEAANYQVLRPDQRRYFGHPDLLLFIRRLSNQVRNLGLGEVLVGDMAMPPAADSAAAMPAINPGWMRISGCNCRASAGRRRRCLNRSRWIWWRPTGGTSIPAGGSRKPCY